MSASRTVWKHWLVLFPQVELSCSLQRRAQRQQHPQRRTSQFQQLWGLPALAEPSLECFVGDTSRVEDCRRWIIRERGMSTYPMSTPIIPRILVNPRRVSDGFSRWRRGTSDDSPAPDVEDREPFARKRRISLLGRARSAPARKPSTAHYPDRTRQTVDGGADAYAR